MSALDRVLPVPRSCETDSIDLAVPPERAWALVRHTDLGHSPFIRALFAVRTLPSRMRGTDVGNTSVRLDDLVSSPERPGFGILVDEPLEVVVGAIGKVWHLDIPFVHIASAEAFASFREPGFVKVAWALRVSPLGKRDSRLTVEVRVDATDDESWKKFRRYFRFIGPGSHFIRRSLLSSLARDLGTPESKEAERPLPGDDLLPDAEAALTDGITIAAPPEAIWPWLLQMGCRRAGYYAIDVVDNAAERSAREVHPELQDVHVGDVLPASPEGDEGFEVLRIDPELALILGGLWDPEKGEQLRFHSRRPAKFWHVTWAFVLEPLDQGHTRLHVRARGAFPRSGRLHASMIRPVHRLMQRAQLRHLAARVEGRQPLNDWRDVAEGLGGAAIISAAVLTPFLRERRSRWGLDSETAARALPGDDLVPEPRWAWTHGVEIDAPASDVWPWVAQIGADRAGFYSYQWLENLAGCELRNAEAIHTEWAAREGQGLVLHPRMPALPIVAMAPGRWFVAHGAPDPAAKASGPGWVAASWLFYVEPLGPARCRFISRYRVATAGDIKTRLSFGPVLIEPVGFAMDRRMLMGVKERAEKVRARAIAVHAVAPPA